LWVLGDAWLRRSTQVISQSADALNTLNVFPVADADTGSNLKLTMLGVAAAVPRLDRRTLDEVVQGAISSAHGNSGAIVAEMVSSVCRALQQNPASLTSTPPGALVARLLQTVAAAATQAVARPVSGTILTVADEAAAATVAASGSWPGDALAVATAAQHEARAALARTPEQLDVLGEAGVVDAGGQAFVLLLDVLVEVLGGQPAEPLLQVRPPLTPAPAPTVDRLLEYEVMYALSGAAPDHLDELRSELSDLGSSVVVVGDTTLAQVHVHLGDAGAAVEAALGRGRLSRVRITALTPTTARPGRSVLAVVAGPGLADAVRAHGGMPVLARDAGPVFEDLTAAAASACDDLVILPNDMESLEIARHVAQALRAEGRRIAVIPTVAQVQGLAAMAVHEPSADFEAAVIAMSRAAGHARHAAVTIAESAAMTMAGRCDPGDVLGVFEGDFVEIGGDVTEVGWRVVLRLLTGGGELLTLIGGAGVAPAVLPELARRARASRPDLEVEELDGGQRRYLVLAGLE
ncbi:MAG: DAK2 domain-containing protein, partial [Actinomycetes bacterium]